eukprot:2719536-Prymnesium_polylepis.1
MRPSTVATRAPSLARSVATPRTAHVGAARELLLELCRGIVHHGPKFEIGAHVYHVGVHIVLVVPRARAAEYRGGFFAA